MDKAVDRQDIKYFERKINEEKLVDNIKNEFGQTVVIMAALRNKTNLLKYFYKQGANMNLALFNAASNGNAEAVRYLLTLNINVDERDREQNNDTPLIQAAYGGYLEIVKNLVEAGAEINAKDKFGQSVLTKANWSNNDDLVSFLQDIGAK